MNSFYEQLYEEGTFFSFDPTVDSDKKTQHISRISRDGKDYICASILVKTEVINDYTGKLNSFEIILEKDELKAAFDACERASKIPCA